MTDEDIDWLWFFVAGDPETKGSTRSFRVRNSDRIVTTSDNPRLKNWEARVALGAQRIAEEKGWKPEPWPAYYTVALHFFLKRPGAPKYVTRPAKRPDLDKLTRAVLDAISGILYADDGQVVSIEAEKLFYGGENVHGSPGLQVNIIKKRMVK